MNTDGFNSIRLLVLKLVLNVLWISFFYFKHLQLIYFYWNITDELWFESHSVFISYNANVDVYFRTRWDDLKFYMQLWGKGTPTSIAHITHFVKSSKKHQLSSLLIWVKLWQGFLSKQKGKLSFFFSPLIEHLPYHYTLKYF